MRDAARYACARLGPVARDTLGALRSPDGHWEAFVRGYDLYLRAVASGEVVRLTTDGARDLAYGAQPGGRTSAVTDLRSGRALPPDAMWSPDSKRLLTQRLDERGVGEMYLLESARADGSYRPKLWSYHYPVPGDSVVPRATLLLVDVERRAVSLVRTEPLDVLFASPIALNQVWWDSTGSNVYALRRERGMRAYQVMAIDAASGAPRVLLEERGPTLVEPHLSIGARPNIRVLGDGSVVGYSERDGWGHLYLFDGASGACEPHHARPVGGARPPRPRRPSAHHAFTRRPRAGERPLLPEALPHGTRRVGATAPHAGGGGPSGHALAERALRGGPVLARGPRAPDGAARRARRARATHARGGGRVAPGRDRMAVAGALPREGGRRRHRHLWRDLPPVDV